MTMSDKYPRIPADQLRRFCVQAFEQVGLSTRDAALVADTLVDADLRGVHSHGTWWLTTYTERLRHGGLNPNPQIQIVRDLPSMAIVDAGGATGQVASAAAMRLSMDKARSSGVGVSTVRNSNHFGAAAYYAMMAAQEGQIGFATTDAEPTMAPWGGLKLVVGNNPLAFAAPVDDEFAVVLDMAQSVVAWGKIFLAAQRGEKIPAGWAVTPDGEATEDPVQAMAGFLQPVGQHKGYGLALMMEILSGVLSGAVFGASMPPMEDPTASQGHGHFFLAIEISHFMPLMEFKQRMSRLVAEQRYVPLAPGVERIFLPGEIEYEKKKRRLQSGIPLEPYIIESLTALGRDMGLETGFLRQKSSS
jgi:LDH2 family malate/lactate/ureidoglycolate dehydrogenase